MKKICFIIPTLGTGGMERVMVELINEFSKDKNLNLYLILYGFNREIFYTLSDSVKIYIPSFLFDKKARFYSTIKTLLFVRKQVKEINPDTILSFGEYWNSFVILALKFLRYPIYVSDRCQPDKSLGFIHDLLRKILYPKTNGVIAQTETAKNIFENLYRHNKVEVIGNPIRKIENHKNIKKENIILTVGRLINTKNHDKLIRLFAEMNRKDWRLIIIGGDSLKQNNSTILEKLIVELNIKDNVFLIEKTVDIDDFYLKSKIFAFTSSSEGFPNVIGEAMSAGLPAVAFDSVTGITDLITNGFDGFLVEKFNYDEFKNKLISLMEDEYLRTMMGENAKISIKKFSSDLISNKFKSFILN